MQSSFKIFIKKASMQQNFKIFGKMNKKPVWYGWLCSSRSLAAATAVVEQKLLQKQLLNGAGQGTAPPTPPLDLSRQSMAVKMRNRSQSNDNLGKPIFMTLFYKVKIIFFLPKLIVVVLIQYRQYLCCLMNLHMSSFNMASQQQTDKTPHQGQHSKKPYGGFWRSMGP